MPRTCPHCGFTEESERERCAACGRSVLVRPPRLQGRSRRHAGWAAAVGGIVLAAVITLVVLQLQDARRERDRAASARAAATERARLTRLQTPHRGSAADLRPRERAGAPRRRAARAALVRRVEARITADARARARAGELKGPIRATECGPFLHAPGAVPDDRVLGRRVGRYDCVAVKADIRQGSAAVGRLGYPFVAAVDFRRFTFVWCRNTPPPSERGQVLAFVRLDRACLAAKGAAVGTGYADVPGS